MKQKSQVIGVRLPINLWNEFEIKCIEDNLSMSDVLRSAVKMYMESKISVKKIKQIKQRQ